MTWSNIREQTGESEANLHPDRTGAAPPAGVFGHNTSKTTLSRLECDMLEFQRIP